MLLTLLFNIALEIFAMKIRPQKQIYVIQISREEVKLSIYAGDINLYIENLKSFTKYLVIGKISKVVRYKINT